MSSKLPQSNDPASFMERPQTAAVLSNI